MRTFIKAVITPLLWVSGACVAVFLFFSLAADGWYLKAAQRSNLKEYDAGVAAGQIMGRLECQHE